VQIVIDETLANFIKQNTQQKGEKNKQELLFPPTEEEVVHSAPQDQNGGKVIVKTWGNKDKAHVDVDS